MCRSRQARQGCCRRRQHPRLLPLLIAAISSSRKPERAFDAAGPSSSTESKAAQEPVGPPPSYRDVVEGANEEENDKAKEDSIVQQPNPSDWPNYQGFDVHFEQRTPVALPIEGSFPSYAAGVLYRTGPAGFRIDTVKGTFDMAHWFDGICQTHRFELMRNADNSSSLTILYNSRRTADEMLEQVKATGTLEGVTFANKRDPCQSFFSKVMSTFTAARDPPTDRKSANICVTLSVNMPGFASPNEAANKNDPQRSAHGIQSLHSKTDSSTFQQLSPETLEPIGLVKQTSLHPALKGPMSGAHSKSDPATGDVYNYNLELGPTSTYRVFHTSATTGQTRILAEIKGTPAYLHSIFLTPEHVILCIWNSHITAGGVSILWNQNILDSIAPFDQNKPATWYVVDRTSAGLGLLATYESDPFYCFHTVNAWVEPSTSEDGASDIIAEAPIYANLDILHKFYYENLLSQSPAAIQNFGKTTTRGEAARPMMRRFRLPAVPSTPVAPTNKTHLKVQTEWTAPRDVTPELPTLNPAYLTRRHRYTYGVVNRHLSTFIDGIAKFDNANPSGAANKIWSRPAHTPGEAIFIAEPDGAAEDDGVLLSVVLDGKSGKSYLLCLDARDLSELGRAYVDGVVGFGFHGTHVKDGGNMAATAET